LFSILLLQSVAACSETAALTDQPKASKGSFLNAEKARLAKMSNPQVATLDSDKARFDWQMNCQGCHSPDGSGSIERDVPPLVDLKNFHALKEGREFLIRVPGVARSPLGDSDLANLSNWMMEEFGGAEKNRSWTPYSAQEISELRRQPFLEDVRDRRQDVMARLQTQILKISKKSE
jgi:mono/diheme cytochrome c family protein